MKTLDTVHRFNDRRTHVSKGLCRVRCFVVNGSTTVLLTDMGDRNDGPSVTNAVEAVIESLLEQGVVIPPATFVEHYERTTPGSDTYDLVTLSPRTHWHTLSRDEILQLIGGNECELNERTLVNTRIGSLADRLRYKENPFVDSRYIEPDHVIQRRLEIIDSMISKREIDAVVQSQAGEREIQRLLKRDLSVFGECYGKPDDEYICFSEFPLDDGLIDFVVFTGRSRMDVVLIEVKGAEFNLVKSNHYRDFNHKITEAASQVRRRLGAIYRKLDEFRVFAHEVRQRAELGDKESVIPTV